MKRYLSLILAAMCMMPMVAKVKITRTSCNYQYGLALVKDGKAKVCWQMTSDVNGDKQTARRIVIRERVTNKKIYDSGKVKSDESQLIALPVLKNNTYGYAWQVMVWDKDGKSSNWSKPQDMRCVNNGIDATWVGAITKATANIPDGRYSNGVFKKNDFKEKWANVDSLSTKSIVMRKEFSTGKKNIVDAVVYVCGLGHYEMNINGQKVGDSMFAPLWSEYNKTAYYNVYDVTDMVKSGANAVSILLGNGFYNVQKTGRYSKLQMSFGAPSMIMKMVVNYSDGTQNVIRSGTDWKYTLSAVTYNSIYGGESYDARLVQSGYDRAGFDDHAWRQAVQVEGPKGILTAQTAPPVKIMEHYDIKKINSIPADSLAAASKITKREINKSVLVCDMGQNLAGFPEITVTGKRGQKITMYVAEKLTIQGACDQRQSGRPHYYEYTLSGEGTETWHPQFSYYGFRYIQVEGAVMAGDPNPDNLPVISRLQSCFIYDSAEEVSSFECSNSLFTRTHNLIERAERSNMQSVLSDCPHREKLGWLEQDHLCGPSLLYNYDMTAYIPKIIRDITDTQKDNGMVPTTAPQYVSFGDLFDDSPEWGSTLVILPFMYYEQYGDSTLIIENYKTMSRYMDYLGTRAKDNILDFGLGDWYDYGPWVAGFSKNTPIALVATAHYIFDLQLMTKAAKMNNDDAAVKKYSDLLTKVTKSFNDTFYKPDSCIYATGSQTALALPLFLGITGNNKEAVLKSLMADIAKHGNRLTTGDVGNRYLFQTLAQNGKDELLYTMLNHYDTPGYGFQLKHNATTLTEQWDPRNGSSWNHFMMGQIDEWLFKTLGGINNCPGTNGLRHLLINPKLVGDLTSVNVSTASLYGKVSVCRTKNSIKVDIPVGCDATIVLPNGNKTVGSGKYEFNF